MIRKFETKDENEFISMHQQFYNLPAVLHKVEKSVSKANFDEALKENLLFGFIFEKDNEICGYSIVAKSFSSEVGGICYWIEEIFVKDEFQNQGFGKEFFNYFEKIFMPDAKRIRLEVSPDNKKVISYYNKFGFQKLDYIQMVLDK